MSTPQRPGPPFGPPGTASYPQPAENAGPYSQPAPQQWNYAQQQPQSYGQQQPQSYAQPQAPQAYGQQPPQSYGQQQAPQSYGQQAPQSYGQPQAPQSYRQPQAPQSYGQPQAPSPYGQPQQQYGQQAPQLSVHEPAAPAPYGSQQAPVPNPFIVPKGQEVVLGPSQPGAAASEVAPSENLAPWAADGQKGYAFTFTGRLLFFLVVIPLIFATAVWMHFWLIVVTVVMALIVSNFFNQVTRLLDRYPKIRALGPLGKAFDFTVAFRDFYKEHKPSWLLYYVFFPIAAPIACIFRPVSRREVVLWGRTFLLIVSGDVINSVLTYRSIYPPFLGPKDAVALIAGHLFGALFFSVACLMPVMTTGFRLSLGGHPKTLGVITALSLLLSFGVSALTLYGTKELISPTSQMFVSRRMMKRDFRKEVDITSDIILTYLVVRGTAEQKAATPSQVMLQRFATDRFRDMINHAAINDEPKAFYVYSLRVQETGGALLYLVVYTDGKKIYPLFIMDEKGNRTSSWSVMPSAIQTRVSDAFKEVIGKKKVEFVPKMADEFPGD